MELFAAFLVIAFLSGLVIGMMHPNWVYLPAKKNNRHNVWIYYGLGLLVSIVLLAASLSQHHDDEVDDNVIHNQHQDMDE